MAKVSPWYSIKTMDVHHNSTQCNTGNNIEKGEPARGNMWPPAVPGVRALGAEYRRSSGLGAPQEGAMPRSYLG